MQPSPAIRVEGLGGFGGELVPEPYDSFMYSHLRYYGYFRGEPWLRRGPGHRGTSPHVPSSGLQLRSPQGQKMGGQKSPVFPGGSAEQHASEEPGTGSTKPGCLRGPGQELSPPGVLEQTPRQGTPVPSVRCRGSLGEPRALFALPSARGPLPAPHWPVECEVIEETIKHIEWVPPEPEPFCQPVGPEQAPAIPSKEPGTVVYHFNPAPRGSCFTHARVGGAPGPLSSPAAPLEGPQDTTLLFESRFESGNLQKAVKVGPYEYVLTLRPDLYTCKHTQWFYFRVQNTRQDPLYRFTIANLAKPKSLYSEGLRPLLYSQRDAQSRGIGWRRVGTDLRYYRGGGGGEEPATFCLSWTVRFPHNDDTCFFAHSYPYTYSDLQRYLRALASDPMRSQYCTVRALCRSLAGNTVYLLTITSPAGVAAKRVVVLSARAHPGESGSSWAMQGCLDFLLGAHADAQLLRRLFIFKVVPMLNPDGVVVGNSRCSLAGRDPNRAYRTALRSSFPSVWHLRAMVERVLAEREVVLYCDFHGHSRKNNVFMYGCDSGRAGAGPRLCQRVFPLMLSKNAPDKFSFPSCKFKVQKSKAGTGRVVMWRMGVSNSYTMEAAFGGSTLGEGLPWARGNGARCVGRHMVPRLGSCHLFRCALFPPGGRNSHFTVEDLKSLGYHLCDTLLDFCDPDPAKFQQCLSEVDTLLRQRLGHEPGSGGSWSDVSASELESSTSGSDSSVSDETPAHLCGPAQPERQRRKQLRSRRARNALNQTNAAYQNHANIPARPGPSRTHRQLALPGTPRGGSAAGEEPRAGSVVTVPSTAGVGAGHRAAIWGSQLDSGTSAVSRHQPLLSTHHPGVTSDSSRDTALGAKLGLSKRWGGQRGGQVAAARRHRAHSHLTTHSTASLPAARRCWACARD
ncbi:cytosolic carboxypeptidase 2 isoform X2 [Falco cherrug]|uniref:cytosolic carboxypeptidase 2 isoform X2 n=1 Tax=Falco cherrug TaxID=345164 RepID=UPI00247AE5AC|nr:cytosolic carboxypeptidase 2 isoform X2 [Falco cherrug]